MPRISQIDRWNEDPEYSALPAPEKQVILENYFDKNLADSDFQKLPSSEKTVIRSNFSSYHMPREAPPAPVEQPPEETMREQIGRLGARTGEVAALGLRGAAEGLTTELPGMAGRAMKFVGSGIPGDITETMRETTAELGGDPSRVPDFSWGVLEEVGKDLGDWAEAKKLQWFGPPKKRKGVERWVYEGAKMLAPSVLPGAIVGKGIRVLSGVGKLVKASKAASIAGNAARAAELMDKANKAANMANNIASLATASMFGLSQAQQTRDTAEKQAVHLESQGKFEEAKKVRASGQGPAAIGTGVIEAAGEYYGTKYLGKLFRLDEAGVAKRGAKNLVKDFMKTLGVEVSTEVGQQAGQAGIEQLTGIRPEADPIAEALDVVGPTVFMTLLTGGLSGAIDTTRESTDSINLLDEAREEVAPEREVVNINLIKRQLKEFREEVTGPPSTAEQAAEVLMAKEARDRHQLQRLGLQIPEYKSAEEAAQVLEGAEEIPERPPVEPAIGPPPTAMEAAETLVGPEAVQEELERERIEREGLPVPEEAGREQIERLGLRVPEIKPAEEAARVFEEEKPVTPPPPTALTEKEKEIPEPKEIDAAANEAATSPLSAVPQPTQAQKEAGNYKKGAVKIQGLDISIENPKGSKRTGKDSDGETWETTMKSHYGYIKGTVGKDKDHIDIFIGDSPKKENVYVVDQINPNTGKFDEHKALIGFGNMRAARKGYRENYEKGWKGLGAITKMPVEEFKEWAKDKEKTKLPLKYEEVKDARKISADERRVLREEKKQLEKEEQQAVIDKEKEATRKERKEEGRPDIQRPEEARRKARDREPALLSRQDVEKAIKKGQFVPPDILRKYPDLVEPGEIIEKPEKYAVAEKELAQTNRKIREGKPGEYVVISSPTYGEKKSDEYNIGIPREGEIIKINPKSVSIKARDKIYKFPPEAKISKDLSSFLEKKPKEKYAVVKEEKPGTVPRTQELIESVFPGQDIKEERVENKDVYVVTLKNGLKVNVERVVDIVPKTPASLIKGYGKKALGEGEYIAGVYIHDPKSDKTSQIKIATKAGKKTLHHESIHFLEDFGIITKQEFGRINRHIKQKGLWDKSKSANENRAEWLADEVNKPAPASKLGKIWNKIKDFVSNLVNKLGIRTVGGVVREIKTGKIYEKGTAPGFKPSEKYAVEREDTPIDRIGKEPWEIPKEEITKSYGYSRMKEVVDYPFDENTKITKNMEFFDFSDMEKFKLSEKSINLLNESKGKDAKWYESLDLNDAKLLADLESFSGPMGNEKTFYRYGDISEPFQSYNYRDGVYEDGVSVYPTATSASFAGLEAKRERKLYYGKGRQVGWGTDNEPVIIPTNKWKIFNHRKIVKEAILEGKPVPDEVLKGYPSLVKLRGKTKSTSEQYSVEREGTPTEESEEQPGLLRRQWDEIVFQAQDKFHYLNKAQMEAKRKNRAELPEEQDAYAAETRYAGIAGAAIEDFEEEYIDPMLDIMGDNDITIDELGDYLHARHAREANAVLMERNPDEPNNEALSGMTDEDADLVLEIVRDLPVSGAFEELGRMHDQITKAHRDILRESGQESKETIKQWEDTYDFYAPLMREGKVSRLPRRGKGFDVRWKQKIRAGSHRPVVNVLAHTVANTQAAIIRAEKLKVARTFLEFARNNEGPWEIDTVKYAPSFDADGLIQYRPDPSVRWADNVMIVKEDGVNHRIVFDESNLNAMRIASAMKNLDAGDIGALTSTLLKVNRYLAMVNTALNPEFIISNFLRDLQTAGYNMSDSQADEIRMKAFKDIKSAWRGIREFQKGKKGTEWAEWYNQFRKAGAKVGWMQDYADVPGLQKDMVKKLKNMQADKKLTIKRGLNSVIKFIEQENTAVENAVRLSVFKNLIENDVSESKAAVIAKELTVNFNRKGNMGLTLNAMYLFYNASIQGSARLISAARTSPKVRKMMAGTVAFAAALDVINRAVGGVDDDGEDRYDKIAPWVKERNMIIMLPDGKGYVKIILPWGYNIFHVMGQVAGEAISKKDFDPLEGATRVAGATISSFNPVGGEASILQVLSPTLTDPIVQWAENKDWAGRKLRPDTNVFAPKPSSQTYWNSVREPSKAIAEKINELTGGDVIKPGKIDISPEAIDLAIDTFTGGAGKFLGNLISAPIKLAKGEELESYEIPILRRVYGKIGKQALTQEFYENIDAVQLVRRQYKHYLKDKKKLKEIRKQNPAEIKMLRHLEKRKSSVSRMSRGLSKLRKRRNAAMKAGNREKVDLLNSKIEMVMRKFNKRYLQYKRKE